MRADAAFNRRVMLAFEAMLDQPLPERESWLDQAFGDDPAVTEAVRAMAAASRSSHLLPTLPPEPQGGQDDEPVPERIGQYRIIRELGRGGMGVVYLGERADGLFEHKVAIKLMRRTLLSGRAQAHFATERRILARLRHPHIAQMHDGGITDDGHSYIVMELIDGAPITGHCEDHGLGLADRLALFEDAAGAVEYAHQNLIVHADIKPSNVVVEEGFGVKLLDFGIGRLLGEAEDASGGGYTPGYASPGRLADRPPTPSDDIYALGMLLRDLLRGVPGTNADLAAIVAKASAAEQERRYGTVGQLSQDIARWRAHRPVSAAPPGRRAAMLLLWRRRRLGLTIAGAALLALLVGLGVVSLLFLRSERQHQLAEQRYAATQHMADYIIGDVDPALARVPGTLALRKQLVERTGLYLRGLEANRFASPALKRDIAAGYLRMAKIYGLDPSGGIGDLATAKADLAHAERLIDEAAAAEPGVPELLALRGQAKMLAGTEVFPAPSQGTARASLTDLQQSLGYFEAYLRLRPRDISARLSRWEAEMVRQRAYLFLDRSLDGVADLEADLAEADMAVQTPTQRDEREFDLNASYLVLGESYRKSDPARAIRYLSLLVAHVDQLRKSGQLDWESDLTQASGYIARAQLEDRMARTAASAADYQAGIAILRKLLLTESNSGVQWELAYTRMSFAVLLSRIGRYGQAADQANAGIAWLRQDAAAAPHDPARRRSFAIGLSTWAKIARLSHADAKACAIARQATGLWTELTVAHAATPADAAPKGAEAQTADIVRAMCR